jgi:hypothetical protein
MSMEFKTFLVNSYGALPSGQARRIAGGEVIRIHGSRRNNEGAFCSPICVAVTGLDRFVLEVLNLPVHDEIETLVRAKRGRTSTMHSRCDVSVTLETADFEFVLKLGSILRERMTWGREASDSRDGSIEAGTADALSRFAGLLRQYSAQTRDMEKTRPDALFAF